MSQRKRMVTIRIFEDDLETLRQFHPRSGHNMAIRHIVNKYCRKLREQYSQNGGQELEQQVYNQMASEADNDDDDQ